MKIRLVSSCLAIAMLSLDLSHAQNEPLPPAQFRQMSPQEQTDWGMKVYGKNGMMDAAGFKKFNLYAASAQASAGKADAQNVVTPADGKSPAANAVPAPVVFKTTPGPKRTAPTAWAFVIFQHDATLRDKTAKGDKTITLKYVLVSVGGVQRLLVFQNKAPVGVPAGKLQWYWRRSIDGLTVYPPLKNGRTLPDMVENTGKNNQEVDILPQAEKRVLQLGQQIVNAQNSKDSTQESEDEANTEQLLGIDLTNLQIQVDDFDLSDPRFSTVYSPFKVGTVGTAASKATAKTENQLINGVPAAAQDEMKLILRKVGLYGYATTWLIANYAANDTAVQGDTPVVGVAALQALLSGSDSDLDPNSDPKKQPTAIEFQPCQATIARGPSGVTITHTFNPVTLAKQNDLKFDVNSTAILDAVTAFLTADTYQGLTVKLQDVPDAVPATTAPARAGTPAVGVVAASGKPGAVGASVADDSDKPLEKWYAYTLHLSDPVFASDATGTKAGFTINLTAPDSVHKQDFNPEPDLKLSGYTYLESDLFDGTAQLTWKVPLDDDSAGDGKDKKTAPAPDPNQVVFASPTTVGVKFEKSQLPNGTSATKATTSGSLTAAVNAADALNTFNLQLSEAAGAEDTSNTQTGKAAVETTDYHSTTYGQELWHAYANEDQPWHLTNTPTDSKKPGETYEHLISLVTDLNEWIDPAVSEQKSNHYLAAAAMAHIGADVPVPYDSFIDSSPEFIRLDASITGGGVAGESPDTARYYGGNSAPSGGATELPTPIIRSFGTGKLGLYPSSNLAQGSQAGAVSFASVNCTLAIPVGLSVRFLDPEIAHTLNFLNTRSPSDTASAANANGSDSGNTSYQLANDDATHDMVSFVANYDDYFSMRPVMTFDAAWLGAPANFSDRTLYSAGAGVEMSLTALNLDVLYEKTLHDTDSNRQPLSKNIIVQMSYDIHF